MPTASLKTCAPTAPRPASLIARLASLALDIFDGVCLTPAFRPARDFQAIVHNACSLVLASGYAEWHNGQEADIAGMQSLLNLMNDSGLEWPGNFLFSGSDLAVGWGVDEMLG